MRIRRSASVSYAVAWRSLHNMFANPYLLLPPLIFPLFFFVAFAGGLSQLNNLPGFNYPGGYEGFQFVYVLCQASAFGGVFAGFAIAADYEHGFSKRMMLAAPHRMNIVFGYALSALTRGLMVWVLVFSVALLTGMNVKGSGIQMFQLLLFAAILNVCALLFAAGIALRFRTLQAGPLMQLPVFVLLYTVPVYLPRELLTGWIYGVSGVNPITPIIEAGRSLLAGSPERLGLAFGTGLVMLAVTLAWAKTGMRRAEREN